VKTLALAAAVLFACAAAAQASTRPSKRACAVAWNRTATPALRCAIAAQHPRGAFVDVAATFGLDWVKGGKATSTQSIGCGIDFILRNGRVLMVSGPWNGRAVSRWSGPVSSSRPLPVPNTANVRADGTVGFHG